VWKILAKLSDDDSARYVLRFPRGVLRQRHETTPCFRTCRRLYGNPPPAQVAGANVYTCNARQTAINPIFRTGMRRRPISTMAQPITPSYYNIYMLKLLASLRRQESRAAPIVPYSLITQQSRSAASAVRGQRFVEMEVLANWEAYSARLTILQEPLTSDFGRRCMAARRFTEAHRPRGTGYRARRASRSTPQKRPRARVAVALV